jgi:hypothetical protein
MSKSRAGNLLNAQHASKHSDLLSTYVHVKVDVDNCSVSEIA